MNVTQTLIFFHFVNQFWETTVLFCCHEKIKTCKKIGIFCPNYTFTSLELFPLLHILHPKEKDKGKKHYVHTSFYSEFKVEKYQMTKANEVYIDYVVDQNCFFVDFCKIHVHFQKKREKKDLLQKYDSPFSCNQLHHFESFSEKV